ncbi:MAG: thioredoxin [Lachnospiraceae bacterium]|nr:thioredoxin [Lachnospiraceae bacterium]
MSVVDVKKSTFESEVLKCEKPVIVDFWASWCGPCRMLSPIVDEVAGETDVIKFCKINVDEEPDLASQFKVMTIPTLIVFKGGEEVKRNVGVISKEEILKLAE